jgi:hypothetical protein
MHTDIGLVNVLYPVGEEDVRNNKEIELGDQLSLFLGIIWLEPLELVPSACLRNGRHYVRFQNRIKVYGTDPSRPYMALYTVQSHTSISLCTAAQPLGFHEV